MVVLITGFNELGLFSKCPSPIVFCKDGFQSVSLIDTDILNMPSSSIDFSWSSFLFLYGGRARYVNTLNNEPLDLLPPCEQSVVTGSCNDRLCILITVSGTCWEFNVLTKKWKKIVFAELEGDSYQPKVEQVCLSFNCTVVLTSSGQVYSIPTCISSSLKVSLISSGHEHTILLTNEGLVFTWGTGSRGQLGFGDLEMREAPEQVKELSDIVSVAGGGWHSCALSRSGQLYMWGWNKCGQLARPNLQNDENGVEMLLEPASVAWPDGESPGITSVACGSSHTVVLLRNGSVWGCGRNKWQELGLGKETNSPKNHFKMVPIYHPPSDFTVSKIAARHWNTAIFVEKRETKPPGNKSDV